MKQVKPVLIGYNQIAHNGIKFLFRFLLNHEDMEAMAVSDLEQFGVKSKFRPVYAKSEG